MADRDNARRVRVAGKVTDILRSQPVFLDTETTGLGPEDEVVDIAVVDWTGKVLLNSLVKPTVPLPPEVSEINGITPAMLSEAPSFAAVLPALAKVTMRKQVITYGALFDVRLMRQSAAAHGLETPIPRAICAMSVYAEFYGALSPWKDYRWQKLAEAARQCSIPLPAQLHRALADAELMREIFAHMAEFRVKGVTR